MCNRCHGLFSFVRMPGVLVPIHPTLCRQSLWIGGNKRVEDFAILRENIAWYMSPYLYRVCSYMPTTFSKESSNHTAFIFLSHLPVNNNGEQVGLQSLNTWSELCRVLPLSSWAFSSPPFQDSESFCLLSIKPDNKFVPCSFPCSFQWCIIYFLVRHNWSPCRQNLTRLWTIIVCN